MSHRPPFHTVDRDSVEQYGPGVAPTAANPPRPGDFILTHGDEWISGAIRFGQGLRFRGDDAKYAFWNHAALVVDETGQIIEALGNGVKENNLSKYLPRQYHLVRIKADDDDRKEVVAYARYCLDQPYGYMTILSLAYTLITGGKFSFYIEGQEICSGLVARAEERTGAIFDRDPSHIMPADLAKYYKVV